jgi:putative peptide zinc metalloprotease protein
VTISPPAGRGDASASPRPAAARPDVPVLADGIQLIGAQPGSGYKEPPSLVRRADGQMIQLTPLLFQVLEAIDGRRTYDEVAEQVTSTYGKPVNAANIVTLVDEKLRPIGVLLKADGSEPALKKSNPLLGLRMRYAVTDPVKTDRITRPFAALFHPLLVIAVVAAFVYVSWWLLFDKGLASATHEALHKPGLLVLIFVVTVFSAGFHEFGHAAAARRGGSTPGVMGMGLYLFWPAFYTDVTDSYRLGRAGRIRTDLGGLYFNAIVALGTVGVWWATGYDALLLVVATQILQMLRQLTPMIRFDGYHVLADITGVPDLYHRIKPTLLGTLPWRWRDPSATALKPWARLVVTAWVVVVVPLLMFAMLTMVITLPRVLATAWVSLQAQTDLLAGYWSRGDVIAVLARMIAVLALVLPIAGIAYILTRLVRQVTGGVWRKTAGKPLRRGLAVITAMALVAGLAWTWWPREATYRPIAAYERGTLGQALPGGAEPQARVGDGPLTQGQRGQTRALLPAGDRPTEAEPSLALVMVPRDSGGTTPAPADPSGSSTDGSTGTDGGTGEPNTWVFPFDQPLPPEEGDSQALAVNTTDNTVVYDLAFAMIWVDGDEPVTNTNEAYAAASCQNCAAVAVSFQVVLIVGDADIVVPANLATAVNYNCVQCLTYALASQLVVTLDGPLSEAGMAALEDLWAEIADYARGITGRSLSELQAALEGFQDQILDVIENDPSRAPDDDPTTTEPSESPGAESSEAPAEMPSATPSQPPGESPGAAPSESSPAPSAPSETTEPSTSPSLEPSSSAAELTTASP